MGVDTKLYISREWEIRDIQQVLKARFGITAQTEFHEFAPEYVCLNFTHPMSGNHRTLHIHLNSTIGGLPAININFSANPEGWEILRELAKTFGGLFQEQDCESEFTEYQRPGEGDIHFIVKEAIKSDPSLGSNTEKMIEYLSQERWKK